MHCSLLDCSNIFILGHLSNRSYLKCSMWAQKTCLVYHLLQKENSLLYFQMGQDILWTFNCSSKNSKLCRLFLTVIGNESCCLLLLFVPFSKPLFLFLCWCSLLLVYLTYYYFLFDHIPCSFLWVSSLFDPGGSYSGRATASYSGECLVAVAV